MDNIIITDFSFMVVHYDADPALGYLYCVEVGWAANVSEIHNASTPQLNPEDGGSMYLSNSDNTYTSML
jgi:hypothetical protein